MDPTGAAASGSRGPIAAAALTSCLVFYGFLFEGALAGHDWNINFQYYTWIRTGLTLHGALPLFMAGAPYTQDLLANPQSPVLGPLVWMLRIVPAEAYVALLIPTRAPACWAPSTWPGISAPLRPSRSRRPCSSRSTAS